MTQQGLRFGVLVPQDASFPELTERWQLVESLGFDAVYVADHTGDYRNLDGTWFDGLTTLAAMAGATTSIRIGTLVANPVLRAPAVLAKAATTIDHLSGGRLELGIGTGIAGFDHAAAGVEYWPLEERVARYAEYVEIVDGLLRSKDRGYEFHGRYYQTHAAPTSPSPVQRPRPPIIVGGQSRTVRRVAAQFADVWNTHGGFGQSFQQIVETTHHQNQQMDRDCASAGRSPASVRRAVLLFDALDPWVTSVDAEQLFADFGAAGAQEFVLFWPPEHRVDDFIHLAEHVLPSLR